MPKLLNNAVPSYRRHKQSGQAIVTLSGRDILLGKYASLESRDKYNRLVSEWIAAGRQLPVAPVALTIAELVNAYRKHALVYYRRPDGTPTGEASRIVRELSPLTKLYARLAAVEFSPLKLKAVRELMIEAGWCRPSVNHAVGTIKRCFKWATENEMVPPHVHHGLLAVGGLRAGRSEAREPEPVKPVALDAVDAVLPHVSRQVAAMIQMQRITGMRPGELCAMRGCDIDTTTKPWIYRPTQHKTLHHGHQREVYLGPRVQELIRPFLKPDPQAFLFDPREAEQSRRQRRHAARTTPLSCGNVPGSAKKRKPARTPGSRYTTASYAKAIARACDIAFPPPDPLRRRTRIEGEGERAKVRRESEAERKARLTAEQREELRRWTRSHRWHPHQLRHTAGTELRKTHGLEAAQVLLGHKNVTITQVYAEKNAAQAMRIAAEVG